MFYDFCAGMYVRNRGGKGRKIGLISREDKRDDNK